MSQGIVGVAVQIGIRLVRTVVCARNNDRESGELSSCFSENRRNLEIERIGNSWSFHHGTRICYNHEGRSGVMTIVGEGV